MLQPFSSSAEIRRHLNQVLRTDSDLDAFCLDYFPDAHLRFAKGMERTDKVNLLFSLVELADIAAKLRELANRQVTSKQRPGWWGAGIVAALAGVGGLYAVLHAGDAVSGQAHRTASAAVSRCAHQEVADRGLRGKTVLRRDSAPIAVRSRVATSFPAAPIEVNSGNIIDKSPDAKMHNRARLPTGKPPTHMNSGNCMQSSRGAEMDNSMRLTP